MSRPKSNRRYEALALLQEDPRMSMRELAARMSLKAVSCAWRYVDELEKEGLISRNAGEARGIFIGERPHGSWEHAHKTRTTVERVVKRSPKVSMARRMDDQMQRVKKSKSRLDEAHRIDEIVKNAKSPETLSEDAQMVVRENGVKVVIQKKMSFVSFTG